MTQLSFDQPQVPAAHTTKTVNPLLRIYGPGPPGATCKTCRHLLLHRPGANHYYKCALRGVTSGAATDHRIGWPACRRYENPMETTA